MPINFKAPLRSCLKKSAKTLNALVLTVSLTLGLTLSSNAYAAPNRYITPQFYGTINACAAFQDANNRWTNDFRIELSYYDGDHLSRFVHNFRRAAPDKLYAVFLWGPRDPVIIDMQTRPGFSTASTTVRDIEGNTWRISRSWGRCSRYYR